MNLNFKGEVCNPNKCRFKHCKNDMFPFKDKVLKTAKYSAGYIRMLLET